MAGIKDILREHAREYPEMLPQDAVKLIYQNEFGAGHLVDDPYGSLARLRYEYESSVKDLSGSAVESIGNGYSRFHLRGIKNREQLPALNSIFVAGAANPGGSRKGMEEKLGLLLEITKEGAMPFSRAELSGYIDTYIEECMPAARHSERYRTAYSPAYRVVRDEYLPCLAICAEIDRLLGKKERAVIAVDGRCGSGKTTLAGMLRYLYGCDMVSMDDFFLPPGLRTEERLGQPGGNIHYERFEEEAVPGLRSGESFQYRIFDCSKADYNGAAYIEPQPVVICEGTYSLHPRYANLFNIKIFVTCSVEEQKRRILLRSGAEQLQRFENEWIPMEESYFKAYSISDSCGFVIDTI